MFSFQLVWDGMSTSSQNLTRLRNEATALRSRQEFQVNQLTELVNTDFESSAKKGCWETFLRPVLSTRLLDVVVSLKSGYLQKARASEKVRVEAAVSQMMPLSGQPKRFSCHLG